MDKYVYLALVDVCDEPYLVQSENPIPGRGFVEFRDGLGVLLGRIVRTDLIDPQSDTYGILNELRPIFTADEVFGSLWRREEDEDAEA